MDAGRGKREAGTVSREVASGSADCRAVIELIVSDSLFEVLERAVFVDTEIWGSRDLGGIREPRW